MNQDYLNKLATAYIQFYSGIDLNSDESIYDGGFNLINKELEPFEWAKDEVIELNYQKSELLWDFVLEVLKEIHRMVF